MSEGLPEERRKEIWSEIWNSKSDHGLEWWVEAVRDLAVAEVRLRDKNRRLQDDVDNLRSRMKSINTISIL